MDKEEIERLLRNPDEFIRVMKEKGVAQDIKKTVDSARLLVREKYKMKTEEIQAVEFCFWFTYFVEREVRDLIIYPEVMSGARLEAMDKIIDRLHFGDKISLISDLYIKDPNKDEFIKTLWKINNLRNSMAHGRFNELKHGEFYLSEIEGQIKIIMDFMNSALHKKESEAIAKTGE